MSLNTTINKKKKQTNKTKNKKQNKKQKNKQNKHTQKTNKNKKQTNKKHPFDILSIKTDTVLVLYRCTVTQLTASCSIEIAMPLPWSNYAASLLLLQSNSTRLSVKTSQLFCKMQV